MYIHRIVIDADRINTRGGIPEMNSLETLHDIGLIEIFQTSTLAAEFRTWRHSQKARNYTVIGDSSFVYVTNSKCCRRQLLEPVAVNRDSWRFIVYVR